LNVEIRCNGCEATAKQAKPGKMNSVIEKDSVDNMRRNNRRDTVEMLLLERFTVSFLSS